MQIIAVYFFFLLHWLVRLIVQKIWYIQKCHDISWNSNGQNIVFPLETTYWLSLAFLSSSPSSRIFLGILIQSQSFRKT